MNLFTMEDALVEWKSVFDEASYNIWRNSSPQLALVQVMFHILIKRLQSLQKEVSQNHTEKFNMPELLDNVPKHSAVRMSAQSTTKTVVQNTSNADTNSPDIFKDISILSASDMNISDNIFNRLITKSPSPDRNEPMESILISPTINRRKSIKKKKLTYPELNTSEKFALEDTLSGTYSQTSLINYSNKEIPSKNESKIISDLKLDTKTTPKLETTKSSEILRPRRSLSKIQKRLHDIRTFASGTEQNANSKKDNLQAAGVVTNESLDATILLTCPLQIAAASDLNEEQFREPTKVSATKPMFLSKWQQRRLQEEDLDEQNCSKCGNFGGFKDLSPTMCGTNGFKCQKHRKKYLRPNTPSAIWNLNFPGDNE